MKKRFAFLFMALSFGLTNAQWTKTNHREKTKIEDSNVRQFYTLDMNTLRSQLQNAPEMGRGSIGVQVSIPTMDGKVERFTVYSFPVVDKELAVQYDLGSYVGVGLDDPSKYIRFSTSPVDFQSMIIKNGKYEFISPMNADKTVYGVHYKTIDPEKGSFVCSTEEGSAAQAQMNALYQNGSTFSHNPTDFAKSSDKKYRTLRLAVSVTGEYTQYHGGTVAGALSAINATLTRVNGIFEKDFALHLNLQNFPAIIYLNPGMDPYTSQNNWNVQLQQTLTNVVGNANYDIGHLFGQSGGNGNAGCIGCICVNPANANSTAKGSAFTSSTVPQGDAFDIDYVAHEMGHQLGATHTFSMNLEGTGTNMEPGSGSTIMSYAGITNSNVQNHADPYFHVASIIQVQQNLNAKACDVETPIANNPPSIQALPTYTIPKGTAFALTAVATDPENNPLTYTWEQFNSATSPSTNVDPTSTTKPIFRSVLPSTSPTRYFPRLSEVLNGNLTSQANWETVSNVARTLNFVVTVRDNHPNPSQQQTNSAEQIINVGNNGPFKINTQNANTNAPTVISWDVVGTNVAPYNVANVKIDYTTDNGATWTVLTASTPNDGSEALSFPASLNGQTIKLRISAINNVFYAVQSVNVVTYSDCDGSAPQNVMISGVTGSEATVSWNPMLGATYIVRYRVVGQTAWQTGSFSNSPVILSSLSSNTMYEVQVAGICSGTTGAFSNSKNFKTLVYCNASTTYGTDDHISNISIANMSNYSGPSTYSNYTNDSALQINLIKAAGQQYTLSVSKNWTSTPFPNIVQAWIDYNANGVFGDIPEEVIMNLPASTTTPVSATFAVPTLAVENIPYRMRVLSFAYNPGATYPPLPCMTAAEGAWGEVEDYTVMVTNGLSTQEVGKDDFRVYPNPVSDILNITKVSDKAVYQIHNTIGQIVDTGTVKDNKVNVSRLTVGNYIITIADKDFNGSVKFIKK